MNGLCDVKECSEPTFVGWNPLTESRGRQICERHWRRHLDEKDGFDLYDAFTYRRPVRKPRRPIETDKRRCACGRALEAGHRFCKVCIEERERQGKRLSYHKRKDAEPEPIVQQDIRRCRACGGQCQIVHSTAIKHFGATLCKSGR